MQFLIVKNYIVYQPHEFMRFCLKSSKLHVALLTYRYPELSLKVSAHDMTI